MTRKEKQTAYKVRALLMYYMQECKSESLRIEAQHLIKELEKSLD